MDIYLKILNESGVPYPMKSPDDIVVDLPHSFGGSLSKTMKSGDIQIINEEHGEIRVTLTDFEVQGLKTGDNQDIIAHLIEGSNHFDILFERALTVKMDGDLKYIV